MAAGRPEELSEPNERGDVSLFGLADELQISFVDVYNLDANELVSSSDCRPPDFPGLFISALVNHVADHIDDTSGVYPLCFEEMTLWLIKDLHVLIPFKNAGNGEIEPQRIETRFERPTFAFVLTLVRRALIWFFTECCDGADVLFSNFNKVDLNVYRPTAGIFARPSCRAISRCQALLGQFTRSRAIRRACDVARLI